MAAAGLVLVGAVIAPTAHPGLAGTAIAVPAAEVAPVADPEPDYTPPPVAWGPCSAAQLQAVSAQCGFVEVPLDYSAPQQAKIKLAVSMVKHTTPQAQYQGVMLVNPGGPGGSGFGLSLLGSAVPDNVGASYDWVGFDPRGVGSSQPALSCVPDYAGYNRPDYDPDTPGSEAAWLKRAESYAKACGAKNGDLLNHITTVDSADDMESIRKALGADQINYYGFSYGTYLGQVYATLFPDRVRRMVLDSVVDERNVWYQANLQQDVAFERNIQIFFDWIAKNDGVYRLGNSGEDVEKLFYSQKEKLRQKPAGGLIGPSELTDLFLGAGYDVRNWENVASAFSQWVNGGDAAGLKTVYSGSASTTDDNNYAVYLAVQCTDTQWPTDWNQWREDNAKVAVQAPFETWANAWYNAPCAFWPAKPAKPVQVDGSKVKSLLLIDETLDGATPFEGSLQARRLFPNSALVEGVGGTTHAASLSGDQCVDGHVADYLGKGTLPKRVPGDGSDAQCDPLPQPTPTALVAAGPA
ncbi:alpha/beta hydrolase [Pseudonocardia xinjiangensis]|uniref:Alpha/beta hydrolase n=1 Tax=Pseudonocardia xinjiangensis TaxID=75289 RepID=A0ABX1R8C6_9PSEU|nr:alpha/beta hydrolase [Pseudonocardia xinjiangensis]NMH76636.1 alpha/beta hydrolase [Pseudonocardia xinjiangensis]